MLGAAGRDDHAEPRNVFAGPDVPPRLGTLLLAAAGALVLAPPTVARADEPQRCLGSTHCPPPLGCSPDGVCERLSCALASDCRAPSDECRADLCFAPEEPPWVRDAVRTFLEAELNAGIAVGLNFAMPGVGQFYARDPWGLVPLAAAVTGDVLLLRGIVIGLMASYQDNEGDLAEAKAMMISGAVLLVAACVGGAFWAASAVRSYNARLRRELMEGLALPVWASNDLRLTVGAGGLRLAW